MFLRMLRITQLTCGIFFAEKIPIKSEKWLFMNSSQDSSQHLSLLCFLEMCSPISRKNEVVKIAGVVSQQPLLGKFWLNVVACLSHTFFSFCALNFCLLVFFASLLGCIFFVCSSACACLLSIFLCCCYCLGCCWCCHFLLSFLCLIFFVRCFSCFLLCLCVIAFFLLFLEFLFRFMFVCLFQFPFVPAL